MPKGTPPEEQRTNVIEPASARRLGWGMLLGGLTVFVAAAVIAGIWLGASTSHDRPAAATTAASPPATVAAPRSVLVPDVTGIDQASAAQRLAAARLTAKERVAATSKATGKVVSQQPRAGAKLRRGATVTIVVDRGAPRLTVPDVTGAKLAAARGQLRDVGLKMQTTPVTTAGEPPGTVVSQSPAGGAKAAKGDAVTLSVARSPRTATATATVTSTATATATAPLPAEATVPDVSGQTLADAAKALAAAGLFPDVAYVPSSESPGTVVQQAKAAGSSARPNSFVRVNVATGPSPGSPTKVPAVKGRDRGAATAALSSAGFSIEVLDRRVSSAVPAGRVVGEQPSGGSTTPHGALVILIVGTH